MHAPRLTVPADLVRLRERLDDLTRRRAAALEQRVLSRAERFQLEAMRFELAEAEWHLARLELGR